MKDAFEILGDLLEFWFAFKTMVHDVSWDLLLKILGGIAIALGLILYQWGRLLLDATTKIVRFFSAERRLRQIYREISRTPKTGRWSRTVALRERNLQRRIGASIPILLVANQKGGVGKTTLALNLGADFALRRNKKVLFVDLDFQGTMSSTLLNMAYGESKKPEASRGLRDVLMARHDKRGAEATRTFRALSSHIHQCQVATVNTVEYPGDLGHSGFIDAGSGIGDLEDWLMIRWVAGLDKQDIRFQLARFLHSDEIQSKYGLVILDAPPRATTAGINGFCAATHVVVPSRADQFSWSGARRIIEEMSVDQNLLSPNIKICGFVGTMLTHPQRSEYFDPEIERLRRDEMTDPASGVLRPISAFWPSGSDFGYLGTIRTSSHVSQDAGRTIPYLSSDEVRNMTKPIGDKLHRLLWR